jgi:mevalonate kinase
MHTFYSNGKLLITGEYVVLDGTLSLAIPTQFGQSLEVKPFNEPKLIWKSLDKNNNLWFEDEFSLQNGMLKQPQQDNEISNRLFQILNTAKQINPKFLKENIGFKVESKLTFPRDWGLGSSSTLMNNIANWAKIDAYNLLKLTFGGSGYDIACAQHNSAITYQILNKDSMTLKHLPDRQAGVQGDKPTVCQVNFNPEFKDCLYFVHLNRKQNSREGIEHYKKNTFNLSNEISEIGEITLKIIHCKQLNEFEGFINRHEEIISNIIKLPPVKNQLFKDFQGSIKSLGAWGGDFILATSKVNPTTYFKSKGFETVIPFNQMVLK